MNRVVLFGRLAGRPRLSYTPTGVAVAECQVLVPRGGRAPRSEDAFDAVDCVAFRTAAQELATWGDLDYRVNLEGQLRRDFYLAPNGAQIEGLRVHCDTVSFVDPVAIGIGPDPRRAPRVPLPVPVPRRAGV